MKDRGGLKAIPRYDIERGHWLHECRRIRAIRRVHGSISKNDAAEDRAFKREMCKLRKEYYKCQKRS